METIVRTPLVIFSVPQELVIPLFQRPYVWDEDNQWRPLWQDIRRVAEMHVSDQKSKASHFLGAVVLQAVNGQPGSMQQWSIVDGQQRLTTLQIFFDAAAGVFEELGFLHLMGQLQALVHNQGYFVQDGQSNLKLRHSNRDRAAYNEVMTAEIPIHHGSLEHASSLLVKAHEYFSMEVLTWISEDGIDEISLRSAALVQVLTSSLQLVVISLNPDENSQEIFETLNARGTPLTAADLIKNFVFQRLELEGMDVNQAYKELWPFEDKFWEVELSVGRHPVSRSSLFLNQWLVSRVGEEISPKSTFTRFKHFVEHEAGAPMAGILGVLKVQASSYRRWSERAADPNAVLDCTELCVYRTQAAQLETLKPILLWLHTPELAIDQLARETVIALAESWIMRRAVMRLPMGDLGRVVADLIDTHQSVPAAELASRVQQYLVGLDAASTYWPGDSELFNALEMELAYKRFKRARLRMFLEAVEDHYRGFTGGGTSKTGVRVQRNTLPIEHLMPQKWTDHWPVEGVEAGAERDAHINRIGNLTLITQALNSAVSNGPWLGGNGKWAKFANHDVMLMNRKIRDASKDGWNEERIDQRSAMVVEALIATWPVPAGHEGALKRDTVWELSEVSIRDLVSSGHLTPGTQLQARPGKWGSRTASVLSSGELLLDDGRRFNAPSTAGRQLRGGSTNGWMFWELPDGRRLNELRKEYRNSLPISPSQPSAVDH